MITMRDVGDLVLYLGGVAAALGAIGVLLRYVAVRPLRRLIDERIAAIHEATVAVQETADQVAAEVAPNSGHSLKDAVNRTEMKIDLLSKRFDDHLMNHPRS